MRLAYLWVSRLQRLFAELFARAVAVWTRSNLTRMLRIAEIFNLWGQQACFFFVGGEPRWAIAPAQASPGLRYRSRSSNKTPTRNNHKTNHSRLQRKHAQQHARAERWWWWRRRINRALWGTAVRVLKKTQPEQYGIKTLTHKQRERF